MSLANLAIKRPIFISCVVFLSVVIGLLSLKSLPVDQFPNITFPVVIVSVPYPGAGPEEIETQITKPLEDEISTLSGIKSVRSTSKEGIGQVVAEFALKTDVKFAEQQIRDRMSSVKRKFPVDAKEPVVRRIDPADQPVVILAVSGQLETGKLYDIASENITPKIEQANQVGFVEILGGRKREIHVELDQKKISKYEVSASQVSARIQASGQNIPAGKVDMNQKETVVRTVGEFKKISDIGETIVSFIGNDVPVKIKDLGNVTDSLVDAKSLTYVNGNPSLLIYVFKQSGANTIAVVDSVQKEIAKIQESLVKDNIPAKLEMVRDGAKFIRFNVEDVKESILIGISLTILVVFLFLGNLRSTLITGLALPNSLIGAFILMAAAGFSINVMSLLALSLAVGLLVDDAIVVRENIFRHFEMGKTPQKAAIEGTSEVTLAVLATTFTVIAVFGPIGFLQGVVGQFFKEFGLTICFAMLISLFDAMTIAPMLSAYFGGGQSHAHTPGSPGQHGQVKPILPKVRGPFSFLFFPFQLSANVFDRFQTWLEHVYGRVIEFCIRRPFVVVFSAILIFVGSLAILKKVPKTFLPAQDFGEFSVGLDMPPGTSLEKMKEVSTKVDALIRLEKDVTSSVLSIGNRDGEANYATFFINLVPRKQRTMNTSEFKDHVREILKPFAYANPIVKDIDVVAGGQRPFNVNISGPDFSVTEKYANLAFEKLKGHPALKDVEISIKVGKPEFQVKLDHFKAERLGISSSAVGYELRNLIEGSTPAVFRSEGNEYDIRVRLKDDQRNIREVYSQIKVPNINGTLVHLRDISGPVESVGPATIDRQDRARVITLAADISPTGPGLAAAMDEVKNLYEKESTLPPGYKYRFIGQAENFIELAQNMAIAMGLGILFIYLVLASLYDSFIIPFSIMLVLPLAICGAFYALAISGESLNLFSMIGTVLLLGIATKNSILLVDYANQLVAEGKTRNEALVAAGKARLRPILMTSFALIAGMLPVAIGLNEASKQRTSMGIAVIGGLISSTLLSLLVVPATFSYLDRFRVWISKLSSRFINVS